MSRNIGPRVLQHPLQRFMWDGLVGECAYRPSARGRLIDVQSTAPPIDLKSSTCSHLGNRKGVRRAGGIAATWIRSDAVPSSCDQAFQPPSTRTSPPVIYDA